MACQLLLTDFTLPLKSLKLSHSGQRLKGRSIGSQKASTTVAYYGLKTPPYNLDDLEPYMSKRALEVHWGVHHRDFVDNLNKQLGKSDILYGYTMDELVKATYNNGNPLPEFNNAAEVWNHDFFWESMQPGGGDMPNLGLLEQIENDFGSFTNFRETFVEAALSLFGSGWVWLVCKPFSLVNFCLIIDGLAFFFGVNSGVSQATLDMGRMPVRSGVTKSQAFLKSVFPKVQTCVLNPTGEWPLPPQLTTSCVDGQSFMTEKYCFILSPTLC